MSTIAENLNRIKNAKRDIKAAIENKGITVGDGTIDTYADKIGEISQTVSNKWVVPNGFALYYTGSHLNEPLDVTSWDFSHTTTMKRFFGCGGSVIYANDIDVSNVTDMSYMFAGNINGAIYMQNWNAEKVTTLQSAFSQNITNIDMTGWSNGDKLTDLQYTFENCSNLREIKGIENWNTINVKEIKCIFNKCTLLEELNLSGWDFSNLDSNNTTTTGYMFNGCSALTELDLSSFNTSNVTHISYITCIKRAYIKFC